MPFESEILRDALNQRARKARPHGAIADAHLPLSIAGPGLELRDEARFISQTGETLTGFAVINDPGGGFPVGP